MGWLSTATRTVALGIGGTTSQLFSILYTLVWDTTLSFLNLITPKRRIVPLNLELQEFEFQRPNSTDSRSPCPALNALCNHGLLPRNGRNITFKQMSDEVNKNYNFSRSFCYFVGSYIAGVLRRDYNTDTFDLSDIGVHNGIEHDGSMTRYDTLSQPDQSAPAEKLINEHFAHLGDKTLTAADLSQILTTRLTHSKQTNGQFSLSSIHMFFAAANASTLLLIFGGKMEDIMPFLLKERLPVGWSTKYRSRMGLTMNRFNTTALRVILGIDPSWRTAKKAVE